MCLVLIFEFFWKIKQMNKPNILRHEMYSKLDVIYSKLGKTKSLVQTTLLKS